MIKVFLHPIIQPGWEFAQLINNKKYGAIIKVMCHQENHYSHNYDTSTQMTCLLVHQKQIHNL